MDFSMLNQIFQDNLAIISFINNFINSDACKIKQS